MWLTWSISQLATRRGPGVEEPCFDQCVSAFDERYQAVAGGTSSRER